MAIGDKVQIKFSSLELAQKKVMDAIRGIHFSITRLNDEYTADVVSVGTFRKILESVDRHNPTIQDNNGRPGLVLAFTNDYKTAYPLDATYDFADAAIAWKVAVTAIYQWINSNNPTYRVNQPVLTQADLSGLGVLLTTYMGTVNESDHTW